MIDKQAISHDSLFLKLPLTTPKNLPTVEEFLKSIKLSINYSILIDHTYYLIKDVNLTIKQILKIWEIRLTLLVFNNQLNFAKKEAIYLNNTLYLNEDNGVVQNNVDEKKLQPIYPLPKNNNGLIDYSLMILLIRLKSIPNLNLVNELYKLDYQLRLRFKNTKLIIRKLINLSYDIIVILTINKNYLTLVNFLESIKFELERVLGEKVNDDSAPEKNTRKETTDEIAIYKSYYSNIILMFIIIYIIVHSSMKRNANFKSIIIERFSTLFHRINRQSKLTLYYILKTVSPSIPSPNEQEIKMSTLPDKVDFNLNDLIDLITRGDITGRIICSALAVWDLSNGYGFELVTENGAPALLGQVHPKEDDQLHNNDDIVEECYKLTMSKWNGYICKVYGLE